MVVAAPLLVLARPLVALLWGLPFTWRALSANGRNGKQSKAVWRFFTHPMTAWWVHAAALWLWHIPRFFQATLDNDWIHSAQHVSFLGSALLFWWSLFYAHGKVGYGASVLYLFTTAVHTSILGALLTFARPSGIRLTLPRHPLGVLRLLKTNRWADSSCGFPPGSCM